MFCLLVLCTFLSPAGSSLRAAPPQTFAVQSLEAARAAPLALTPPQVIQHRTSLETEKELTGLFTKSK
ncbi:hypothetical protein SRHO_G00146320 [Serrasalmus rhombeus]